MYINPKHVSYPTAKLLKEKQCDIITFACYYNDIFYMHKNLLNVSGIKEEVQPINQDLFYSVPKQYEVLEWLLIKYNIYITALFYSTTDENYQVITGYKPHIINVKERINLIAQDEKYDKKINGGLLLGNGIIFDTPQDAIEEGIIYCLNKLK